MSVGHGMLANVVAVFSYLEDPARAPDAQFWRILMTGLKEASSRPGALGGAFLTLVPLCMAVGLLRRPND
ncbi:MAG TPA: hypothetical protein VK459_23005 [Polyangiaceae bacterium]|nr:hypothetical protein [Polyangiaceae bacterium]